MLNQVILIGRTTRDVELRETTNGRIFGIMTLAVNRSFKNQATNAYETDFVDVSIWGSTAENVAKYAGKGSSVSVRGRVTNRILDFPGEQTFRTIGIIGQHVSFIQTKAPGSTVENEEHQDDEELLSKDFPTGEEFQEALSKMNDSQAE